MTNLKTNLKSRVISIITLLTLFIALNSSGALAWFWRTVNESFTTMTSWDEVNFSYGYGYGDSGWGYGYGYGYWYNNYGYGYGQTTFATTQDAINALINAFTSNNGTLAAQYILPIGWVNITLPTGLTLLWSTNFSALSGAIITNPTISGYTSQWAIEFGISGTSVQFNKTVKIEIPVSTTLNNTNVKIFVSHNWGVFGTNGLATAASSCTNWVADVNVWNEVVVTSGVATIYTCAASQFAATTVTSQNTTNNSSGWGGWVSIDSCPTGDTSGSYYDGKCSKVITSTGTTIHSTWSTSVGIDGTSITDTDTVVDNFTSNTDTDTWKVTITKKDGSKVVLSDINNSFAKAYIEKLAAAWIVSWYEDGSFKPEKTASRAEYLKIVLRAMNIDYSNADTSKLTFSDVDKNSWIAKVVVKASELKMIDNTNKLFRPNAQISRAEAMKMLINASWLTINENAVSEFDDVKWWAVKYIQKAKELWIVNGQTINWKVLFRPFDNITRAEVSKIVVKTMEQK